MSLQTNNRIVHVMTAELSVGFNSDIARQIKKAFFQAHLHSLKIEQALYMTNQVDHKCKRCSQTGYLRQYLVFALKFWNTYYCYKSLYIIYNIFILFILFPLITGVPSLT